jgi:hypothetical protein
MVLPLEAGIVAMPAMPASLAWEWKRSMQAISAARPFGAADVGGLDTFRWAAQLFPRLADDVELHRGLERDRFYRWDLESERALDNLQRDTTPRLAKSLTVVGTQCRA